MDIGSIFWFCALAGTGMLVIQFLIALIGGDQDDSSIETDGQFKWMSRQAFTGFLMMFGCVGLACYLQLRLSIVATFVSATSAGVGASLISALIYHFAKKAHSPGTVFKIEDAVGQEATVYQRIPANGAGKISIALHDFTHEIDAVSSSSEEIASFTRVQVIKTADAATVVVVPLKPPK